MRARFKSGGLNKNGQYRLICLDTLSTIDGTVLKGLGGVEGPPCWRGYDTGNKFLGFKSPVISLYLRPEDQDISSQLLLQFPASLPVVMHPAIMVMDSLTL